MNTEITITIKDTGDIVIRRGLYEDTIPAGEPRAKVICAVCAAVNAAIDNK